MKNNDEEELNEKRLQLRQQLKSHLLTLSPSSNHINTCQNFIPNCRDLDFLEQQGLDCVINHLQSSYSSFDSFQLPIICSICQTDYTENWWYLRKNHCNEKIYFCDQCEQNRMKQMTLEQHRQSMKLAFLQAKESERRLEVDYQKQRKKD